MKKTRRPPGDPDAVWPPQVRGHAQISNWLARSRQRDQILDGRGRPTYPAGNASPSRHRQSPDHRLGSDRHRPGLRVRLEKREEDLRSQLEQKTKDLESEKAKAEAALKALASQKEKEDLATGQLVGMYSVAKADIAAKNYTKALQSLRGIRDYVNQEEVVALPAVARRREVDLFVVDSLSGLVQGEGSHRRGGRGLPQGRRQGAHRILRREDRHLRE
jgi:hypothetical protein